MTLGDVATSTSLAVRVVTMSGWVMWTAISVFDNIGQVQEGMKTVARPRSLMDTPDARTLVAPRGAIAFENVRFHYGKGRGVIDALSLNIAPGEKVGLVGRSGAGKSTLLNLLLRFYDVEGGRIAIDGEDIAGVTQDSLRRQIGMVTQDTSLLHRSIAENILYGRPEASRDEMIAAARQAHAHDFIVKLTDSDGRTGYETMVGERGVKLSGGQRQRIAIARVLLKDAPILVLDEATSALDSEIESAIQENFQALMRGKTVIAIAHRLSTIAAMDSVDCSRRWAHRGDGLSPRPDRPRRHLRGAVAPAVRRVPGSGGVTSKRFARRRACEPRSERPGGDGTARDVHAQVEPAPARDRRPLGQPAFGNFPPDRIVRDRRLHGLGGAALVHEHAAARRGAARGSAAAVHLSRDRVDGRHLFPHQPSAGAVS